MRITYFTALVAALVLAACSNDAKCKEARGKAAAALQECLKGMGCGPGMSDIEKEQALTAYQGSGAWTGMFTAPDDPAFQKFQQANQDARRICETK